MSKERRGESLIDHRRSDYNLFPLTVQPHRAGGLKNKELVWLLRSELFFESLLAPVVELTL